MYTWILRCPVLAGCRAPAAGHSNAIARLTDFDTAVVNARSATGALAGTVTFVVERQASPVDAIKKANLQQRRKEFRELNFLKVNRHLRVDFINSRPRRDQDFLKSNQWLIFQ